MQDLKYSFQVLSMQVVQTEHTEHKLRLAAVKHWAIHTWTQGSNSYTLFPGFQSQLCKHDKRAQEALHQILSVAKHFLYLAQSASYFRNKVYETQWIPWWKSRKWLLALNNKITDVRFRCLAYFLFRRVPGPTASHAPCGKGDEYTENTL